MLLERYNFVTYMRNKIFEKKFCKQYFGCQSFENNYITYVYIHFCCSAYNSDVA